MRIIYIFQIHVKIVPSIPISGSVLSFTKSWAELRSRIWSNIESYTSGHSYNLTVFLLIICNKLGCRYCIWILFGLYCCICLYCICKSSRIGEVASTKGLPCWGPVLGTCSCWHRTEFLFYFCVLSSSIPIVELLGSRKFWWSHINYSALFYLS